MSNDKLKLYPNYCKFLYNDNPIKIIMQPRYKISKEERIALYKSICLRHGLKYMEINPHDISQYDKIKPDNVVVIENFIKKV